MGSKAKQPAARLGDLGSPHGSYPPTPILGGSPDVFINGRPAARQGDPLVAHAAPKRPPHPRQIAEGASSVLINGRPAARVSDAIDCGGKLSSGSTTVLIGDRPDLPNPIPPAEWEEYIARLPTQRDMSMRGRSQLAAEIAAKHRGH